VTEERFCIKVRDNPEETHSGKSVEQKSTEDAVPQAEERGMGFVDDCMYSAGRCGHGAIVR
jgi:hypothetical protein